MSSEIQSIVIIGAGQAGGWCAKSLRQEGFKGVITLIGNENCIPYERPPLSKAVLSGRSDPESCILFSNINFDDLNLNFLSNDPASQINRNSESIRLESGNVVQYDRLVLATGGRARTLIGIGGDRVHAIRTIEDSLGLKKAMTDNEKLLVIGGGWLGLEVAATLSQQGIEVIVLELQDRLCERAVPPILSDYLLSLHHRHGVEVRLNTQTNDLTVSDNGIRAKLGNGDTVEAG